MYHVLLDFGRPGFLQKSINRNIEEGRAVPFTPAELDRLRLSLPLAYAAQYLDTVDLDSAGVPQSRIQEAKEFCVLCLHGFMTSRVVFKRRIGDYLVVPSELQLAANYVRGRLKLFERLENYTLTEEEILKLVLESRLRFHLEALQHLRGDVAVMFGTNDTRNAIRFENLAYTLNTCVTGDINAERDRKKNDFLKDLFWEAQTVMDIGVSAMRAKAAADRNAK